MFPAQWGQNKCCCFCLQHKNNVAIEAAFRGTLENCLRRVWGWLFWSWGTQTVPMCPQCCNSSGSRGSHSSSGNWRQAHPALCGWAQEGPDSRAPLGCSLKATPEMRGHRLSLLLLTPHPQGSSCSTREVEVGPQSQSQLCQGLFCWHSLRVISGTGLIAFAYWAISEHPA